MGNMILAHELSELSERELMEWTQKDGTRVGSSSSCSMRREVRREPLVYLDLVRTFPDMRSSIQHRSSAGDPNYMHADALLNLYIE